MVALSVEMSKSLSLQHSLFFSIDSLKPFPLKKKYLMKPDTFDFKPFTSSHQLAEIYLLFHNKKIFNETLFDFKLFFFFSYQIPKIYLHFHNKKSLMKPDTFHYKPFLFFQLHLYPPPPYHIPHLLLNRKTQKTVSVLKSFDGIKRTKYHESKLSA